MNPILKFFLRQLRDCQRLFAPLTVTGFLLKAGVAAVVVLLTVSVLCGDAEFGFSLAQLVAYGCWFFAIVSAALTASRLSRLVHGGGLADLLHSEGKTRPTLLLSIALASVKLLPCVPLSAVWLLLRHRAAPLPDFIGSGLFAMTGLLASCFCVALIAAAWSAKKAGTGLLATLTVSFAVVIFMPTLDARFHNSTLYLLLSTFIPPLDILFCPSRLLFNWPSPSAWAWTAPIAAVSLCVWYTLANKRTLTLTLAAIVLLCPLTLAGRWHYSTAQTPQLNLPRSPLGKTLAAQCQRSAQTVWHNGADHDHGEDEEDESHSLSPLPTNSFFPRAMTVSAATPGLAVAHRNTANSLHLFGVIAPLRLAFWLNPDNPLLVADAAFLAAHYADTQELSARLLRDAVVSVSGELTEENAQFWLQVFYSGWEWRNRDLCELARPLLLRLSADADDDHVKTLAQDAADLFNHHAAEHFSH